LTQCAVAFCETVQDAGYQPMVYSNLSYFYLHFDLSQLKDFPLWLAQYASKPSFYYNFQMWQYSSTGTVDGIDGNVDMNLAFFPS
jgi:GH25 family lysozyme M1 (1,4-beta-N-acetylmuramidase)